MGTRYRVMVERIEDVEGAQYETREEILFEAVSPNLASLIRFASTEVALALSAAAGIEDPWGYPPQQVMFGADLPIPTGVTATVFNADGEEIPAAGVAAPEADEPPVEAPKRKRRSRAQIEADKAAEAVAATAEATARAGEAFQQHANGAAIEAGYMAPDGPVTEERIAPAEVPAPALPAVPYNPFAPK